MALKFEKVPHGHLVFNGDAKVAEVHSTQVCTTVKEMTPEEVEAHVKTGVVIRKPMPATSHTIHLVSPSISVSLFKEIAAGIPAG